MSGHTDPDIAAQIAANAEKAILADDEPASLPEDKNDKPEKPDDDAEAADGGEAPDASEEGDEDEEDNEDGDDKEDNDIDDSAEDEDDEDDLDDDADDDDLDTENKEEKPKSRAQVRIKTLLSERNASRRENAVLKAQLAAKDGTKDDKADVDKKLKEQGYKPEEIAAGKKFLDSLGYLPPEDVKAMRQQLKELTDNRLIEEDRAELREAVKKSKGITTEKEVMQYVKKWAKSSNPKIAARASLDYPAIIKLVAGKKATQKAVDETIKAKKKGAPKIPAAGGGKVSAEKKSGHLEWDSGDRMGSIERLQAKAVAALGDED